MAKKCNEFVIFKIYTKKIEKTCQEHKKNKNTIKVDIK